MVFKNEDFLNNNHAQEIIRSIISGGRAGLFHWDISQNKVDILEKITGREFNNIHTFQEFIHELAYEKDYQMALQDLDDFMQKKEGIYQSTFRTIDSEGKVRWVFCKGSMMSKNIFSGIMYDVSNNNLMQGHDLTTNLINEKTFMRKLRNAITYAKEHKQKGALLYIEIDNFHTIINKYGFDYGSDVLYKLSRVLLEYVGEKDELARFPYDKFMMLLNNRNNFSEVDQVSQDICRRFEEPFTIDGQQIYLKINIGITVFPEVSTEVDELIRFSDFALSQSRESGGNVLVFFDSKLMASYNRDMDIENELPTAIPNKELFLVYQPQLELKSNKIIGFETLVRWNNKHLGFVSPAEFIVVAENKGYIVPIGRWIRKESIKTARSWLDQGIDFEKITINISSVEILQKDFKDRLIKVCRKYNVDPKMIELEITERTLLRMDEANSNVVSELIDEGFKMALDDFGTGYSNLSTLLTVDIHTLKLDKSLIDNLGNQKQLHILKGIIASKNHLYQNLVAEGVETKATVDILSELGCDSIQGYHFSKPLPKEEMEQFVADFEKNRT